MSRFRSTSPTSHSSSSTALEKFLHLKFSEGRPPDYAGRLAFAHQLALSPGSVPLPEGLRTDVQREGIARYLVNNYKDGSPVHTVISERVEDSHYILVTANWHRSAGDGKLHLSLYVYREDRHAETWHAYTDRSISLTRSAATVQVGTAAYSSPESLEARRASTYTPKPSRLDEPDEIREQPFRPAAAPVAIEEDNGPFAPPVKRNNLRHDSSDESDDDPGRLRIPPVAATPQDRSDPPPLPPLPQQERDRNPHSRAPINPVRSLPPQSSSSSSHSSAAVSSNRYNRKNDPAVPATEGWDAPPPEDTRSLTDDEWMSPPQPDETVSHGFEQLFPSSKKAPSRHRYDDDEDDGRRSPEIPPRPTGRTAPSSSPRVSPPPLPPVPEPLLRGRNSSRPAKSLRHASSSRSRSRSRSPPPVRRLAKVVRARSPSPPPLPKPIHESRRAQSRPASPVEDIPPPQHKSSRATYLDYDDDPAPIVPTPPVTEKRPSRRHEESPPVSPVFDPPVFDRSSSRSARPRSRSPSPPPRSARQAPSPTRSRSPSPPPPRRSSSRAGSRSTRDRLEEDFEEVKHDAEVVKERVKKVVEQVRERSRSPSPDRKSRARKVVEEVVERVRSASRSPSPPPRRRRSGSRAASPVESIREERKVKKDSSRHARSPSPDRRSTHRDRSDSPPPARPKSRSSRPRDASPPPSSPVVPPPTTAPPPTLTRALSWRSVRRSKYPKDDDSEEDVMGNLDDPALDIASGGEAAFLASKRKSRTKEESFDPEEAQREPTEQEKKDGVTTAAPARAKAVLSGWAKNVSALWNGQVAAGDETTGDGEKEGEESEEDEAAAEERRRERRERRARKAARRAKRAAAEKSAAEETEREEVDAREKEREREKRKERERIEREEERERIREEERAKVREEMRREEAKRAKADEEEKRRLEEERRQLEEEKRRLRDEEDRRRKKEEESRRREEEERVEAERKKAEAPKIKEGEEERLLSRYHRDDSSSPVHEHRRSRSRARSVVADDRSHSIPAPIKPKSARPTYSDSDDEPSIPTATAPPIDIRSSRHHHESPSASPVHDRPSRRRTQSRSRAASPIEHDSHAPEEPSSPPPRPALRQRAMSISASVDAGLRGLRDSVASAVASRVAKVEQEVELKVEHKVERELEQVVEHRRHHRVVDQVEDDSSSHRRRHVHEETDEEEDVTTKSSRRSEPKEEDQPPSQEPSSHRRSKREEKGREKDEEKEKEPPRQQRSHRRRPKNYASDSEAQDSDASQSRRGRQRSESEGDTEVHRLAKINAGVNSFILPPETLATIQARSLPPPSPSSQFPRSVREELRLKAQAEGRSSPALSVRSSQRKPDRASPALAPLRSKLVQEVEQATEEALAFGRAEKNALSRFARDRRGPMSSRSVRKPIDSDDSSSGEENPTRYSRSMVSQPPSRMVDSSLSQHSIPMTQGYIEEKRNSPSTAGSAHLASSLSPSSPFGDPIASYSPPTFSGTVAYNSPLPPARPEPIRPVARYEPPQASQITATAPTLAASSRKASQSYKQSDSDSSDDDINVRSRPRTAVSKPSSFTRPPPLPQSHTNTYSDSDSDSYPVRVASTNSRPFPIGSTQSSPTSPQRPAQSRPRPQSFSRSVPVFPLSGDDTDASIPASAARYNARGGPDDDIKVGQSALSSASPSDSSEDNAPPTRTRTTVGGGGSSATSRTVGRERGTGERSHGGAATSNAGASGASSSGRPSVFSAGSRGGSGRRY